MKFNLIVTEGCVSCASLKSKIETIESLDLKVYNITKRNGKAFVKKYGIKSVPALVVTDEDQLVYNSKKAINYTILLEKLNLKSE
jgi:hypothetical protein